MGSDRGPGYIGGRTKVARAVIDQQADGGALNGRLAPILNAVGIGILPHIGTDAHRSVEAKVNGHVAVCITGVILRVASGCTRFGRFTVDAQRKDAGLESTRGGLAGNVRIGLGIVIIGCILHR